MNKVGEVRTLIERVGAAFSRLDFEAWLDCFHPSHTMLRPDSVFSPAGEDQ
jgi:hypothetical protein